MGWMYGDRNANKMGVQANQERNLFEAKESTIIACL